MNVLRRFGATLCAFILVFSLWALFWSTLFSATLRSRETVKSWFDESGFYTHIVDVVLESAKPDEGSGESDIPISDPQIQAVAKTALSPEFLRQTVEKALDGTYDWMGGSSDALTVNIDLNEAKSKLINGLGDYATTKAAALPVCATNEPIDDFDAFVAICRPRGLTAEAAGQQIKTQLSSNQDFLKDPVITSDDLKIENAQGQKVAVGDSEQAKAVKRSYQFSGFAPIVAGILGLLSIAGIIFLSRNKITGMRRTGYIFASAGVLLGILYTSTQVLTTMLIETVKQGDQTQAFKDLVGTAISVVATDVKKIVLIFTLSYIVVGAILITVGIMKRDKSGSADEPKDNKPEPVEQTESKPEKPIKAEPPTKKKPTKIQL